MYLIKHYTLYSKSSSFLNKNPTCQNYYIHIKFQAEQQTIIIAFHLLHLTSILINSKQNKTRYKSHQSSSFPKKIRQ